MAVRLQERRRLPFFMVGKVEMAQLAGVCESRLLPYARSVYFALLEVANDHRCEEVAVSRSELAERGGVSVATLKRCVPMLVAARLVETREVPGQPNVWTLVGGSDGATLENGVGSDRAGGRVQQSRGSGLTEPPLKETVQEGKKREESSSSSGTDDSLGIPEEMQLDVRDLLKRKTKVNGQLVSEGEMRKAAAALAEFNRQMEADYGLGANLTSVVMRIRERPSWDAGKLVRLVRSAWRIKWWERNGNRRRPSPAVIFGNARVFEQVAQEAREEAAGRLESAGDMDLRTKVWPDGRRWDQLTVREQQHAKEAVAMGIRPWEGREEAVAVGASNGNGITSLVD